MTPINFQNISTESTIQFRVPFPKTFQFSLFDHIGGNYGPAWKLHRKIFVTALRHYMSSAQLMENCIVQQGESMLQYFDEQSSRAFNPQGVITTVMADIICRVTFGNRFDSSHPDFPNFMAANRVSFEDTELNEASSFYDFFPYAQYLPVKAYKEYEKLTEQIYSVLYKQLKEAKVVFDPREPVKDLTCALIKARNDAEEQDSGELAEQLSEDMILNTMSDMFTAGYETTSVTLLWVIAFLTNCPEYQTEIQHELDQVVGWDRFPCLDDRPRLPLVQAAIMEAQRLGNTANCTMPHYTLTDTTLCGYRVPKGTVVYANLEAVHLDPMCWEDPNSYKPSRFIDADGQLISNHGNWFPFGAGRRVCTGEALAKAELFLLVSMMMQNFSFAPVKETKPPSLKGVVRFTKAPVPYTIRAVKRQ